ncbi:Alpha-D-kanosaminyltransferase [bacterium HR41]|nr:Alpha-D-kanosaminyltransferase [bacterium HR41]
MRVCVVYDCLFPLTVGGAERWYRNLAERLAREGHEVTYLTRRQWPRSRPPTVPGVRIVAVSPPGDLYTRSGRRRILPPLLFGIGVLWHLLLHGRRYDVVHTASFPYFSVLAAAAARARGRYRLVVDWHEVWSREYWHSYLGPLGAVGWAVQRLCARVDHESFCFSRLHAERLRTIAPRTRPLVLRGEYAGPTEPRSPKPAEPVVVFAGRHIPEKRVPLLVEAFAIVARHDRELRLEILGDGPERGRVEEAVERHDLRGRVELPGFVAPQEVDQRLGRALCMVLPSMREGYGMVVVEAASRGVPSIVVRAPDNAAVELVKNGENGFVCASDDPEELARAILRVRDAGDELRERTAAWFRRNAEKLSLESSLRRVAASYARQGEPATASACR